MRQLKITSIDKEMKRIELVDQWGTKYSVEICQDEISVYDYEMFQMFTMIPIEFLPFINQLSAL